ncbi:MAG: hypothetical protein [Podoviridae sp. ctDWo9]|nr:MAG: hypothetical protein [Podoviridae sp. ctDWo9]
MGGVRGGQRNLPLRRPSRRGKPARRTRNALRNHLW